MSIVHRVRRSNFWMLIPSLGPPVIWSVHLVLCYLLVTATTVLGDTGVRIEIIAITVVALAGIALCAVIAKDLNMPRDDADPAGLPPFARSLGFATCALFALATLFTLVPVLVLDDL
jgi:hypothetical protein